MHIAAASPQYVRREEVPADVLEREKSIYRAQIEGSGKPAHVIEKIVEGKLEQLLRAGRSCSISPPSATPKTTIGQMVTAAIAKLGENIVVSRFVRFSVGERE